LSRHVDGGVIEMAHEGEHALALVNKVVFER
jgi:hypothetical protein